MKTQKTLLIVLLLSFICPFIMCGDLEDSPTLGALIQPTDIEIASDISTDESGKVSFVAQAKNAYTYHFYFEEDTAVPYISADGTAQHTYTKPGKRTYKVKIIAYGSGGLSETKTIEIEVVVKFELNNELELLTGGNQKTWTWKRTETDYFGVGAEDKDFPNHFSSPTSTDYPCMHDDLLTFNTDFSYQLDSGVDKNIFINWQEVKRLYPDASPAKFVDECREINDKVRTNTSFSLYTNTAGKKMLSVSSSALSYYSGATEYEILELTKDKLSVVGVQQTATERLKWYHTFEPTTTSDSCGNSEVSPATLCSSGGTTGNVGTRDFSTLVWADEFDNDGAPCTKNWTYDIGTGDNGWGNGESQYYTSRYQNVVVQDGLLKISAIKQSYKGAAYTSARLKSQGLFDFNYGRVVVRAKLPSAKGTWPAIWMLGADFTTVGWPATGEIDIMEHVANDHGVIHGTLHYPGHSGGNGVGKTTTISTASIDFHLYEVRWDSSQIKFFVDGNLYHTFMNNSNLPFNKDFFLILNLAMGGGFGGAIDPDFNCDMMEIDYVRVYQ